MAFNTRNPVEPNGSTDPRDLKDNAAIIDKLVNSSDLTWLGRLGKTLKTWAGMQQDFNQLLINTGYESNHLTYTVGSALTVDRSTQLIDYNGFTYRVKLPSNFPVVLTGVWATDSTKLVDVGDASVRNDLANATRGAAMVRWLHSGAGAVARYVSDRLNDRTSLTDFGGLADNGTDTTTPLNNAKNASSGVVKVFKKGTGVYKFNAPFDLNGLTVDPEPGVTFSVTQSIYSTITSAPARVSHSLKMFFSDMNSTYPLLPLAQESLAEKRIWLDDVNADLSYLEALDLNSFRFESADESDGTWSAATNYAIGNNGGRAPYINWSNGAAGRWYRASMGVRIGDEVTANFPTPGLFRRAAFVQHSGGYLALYGTGASGELKYTRKDNGLAPVTNNVAGDIFTTQSQYYAENSVWTIKVLTRRQFVIMLNGVQVGGILQAPGDIMRIGFGFMKDAVASVSISGFTRTRNGKGGGRARQSITVYGDSTWIDQHGGSMDPLQKALSGMGGTQVTRVTNLAVAGSNAGEMLTRMQQLGFNGNTLLWGLLTNDVQGQTDIVSFLNTVAAGIQYARDRAQTVVIMSGRMWYNRSTAAAATGFAAQGQASANAENGAYLRDGLARLCADLGVKYVDLTKLSGPIDAADLVNPQALDTNVFDNIHKTPYLSTTEAIAAAKAIYGAYSGGVNRQAEVEPLPITFSAGWSAYSSAPEAPQMFREGRVLTLLGKASGPTTGGTLNGAQVGQLREDLWPAVPYSSPISYSGGNCKVYISLAGILTVDNYVAAAGSYLDLSVLQRIILRN